VPRYTEMLRSLLAELGWANTQYDVYRVRVQFPVMQTLVCLAVNALKQ
jgi:hypothetical protein